MLLLSPLGQMNIIITKQAIRHLLKAHNFIYDIFITTYINGAN
jgi:hypothetical protein